MPDEIIDREIYDEVSATRSMRGVPRFGRSKDFSKIVSSKEEAGDYIVGLLFAGIFIFSIFFAWTIVLTVFKCLGKKRMGFLSGSPFVKGTRRATISRIIYLFCAACFLIFSITFVTEGLTNLRKTFDTIFQSVRDVNAVSNDLDAVLTDVQRIGKNVTAFRAEFVSALANGGQVCLELQNELDTASDINITEVLATLEEVLENAGAFEPNKTEEFLNAIEYVETTSISIEDGSDNIEIGDWQSLVILIPYIITTLVLVVSVILAYLGIQIPMLQCVLKWFFHPLFIFLTIFAYIVASLILIAASANADFCSGGEEQNPDITVKKMLYNLGWRDQDLVYLILAFYIGQCSSETPFAFLDDFKDEIGNVTAIVLDFTDGVTAAGTAALSDACASDILFLEALNAVMIKNLVLLVKSVEDMRDILECENIVRLYTTPVYDGTCTYSITGVTWAWASFAVVGAMGLTMIMLRSSWKVDVEEDAYAPGKPVTSGEFVPDQAPEEQESVEEEYTPYDPDKDGDNPFEETANEKEIDMSDPQEEMPSDGVYAANVADNEVCTETVMNNEKPNVPAQY